MTARLDFVPAPPPATRAGPPRPMTVLGPGELDQRAAAAYGLALRATALISRPGRGPERSLKDGVADWVTPTDLAVERMVRDVIADLFPRDGVVGEELENSPVAAGHPVWYVDPIDGTTNFAHGLRWCSFSLAVADGAGLAVGVVADVWRNEVFSAVRGQGARDGAGPVRCRTDTSLQGSVVLTELAGAVPWAGMTDLVSALGRQACAAPRPRFVGPRPGQRGRRPRRGGRLRLRPPCRRGSGNAHRPRVRRRCQRGHGCRPRARPGRPRSLAGPRRRRAGCLRQVAGDVAGPRHPVKGTWWGAWHNLLAHRMPTTDRMPTTGGGG